MRSYKNKGVACGGSAPLRLRGRGAVGVGKGGSGDRRTAPEGPWEPGLRRVPRTDPKESSSHRDASSCRPVQRGHLLFSLKGAPRPPRAGRMGGAERQHSRGCSCVCINLSLFAPFTVFPCCLSVFQSLSVSVPLSLFLCVSLSLLSLPLFPNFSLSLSPSPPQPPNPPKPPWPAFTLQHKLFCTSLHTSSPFFPRSVRPTHRVRWDQ